uniref:Zinc finger protein 444 n=1 Tax=Culex pipiens TaxID=7175 RepID=A0A8D8NC37_CULPI
MDINLDTLADYGFVFDDGGDDLQQVDLGDIVHPAEPCSSVLDELIVEYLSGTDSQSSIGSQSSAAVVSPTSSSELSAPEEEEDSKPSTFQELFSLIEDCDELEVSPVDVVELNSYLPKKEPQQFYDVIQVVSSDPVLPDASNIVPVASYFFDSNGLLQVYDPNTAITSGQPKKRGRKPLPRPKGIPGDTYCHHCDKNFKSKRGLLQHTNTHHSGIKPNSCDKCGKRFDLREDMLRHRERHLADNKPFGCVTGGCGKRFMYQSDLDRHAALKHGKAPHSCTICGKGFGRRDHVEKHEISHYYNTVKKELN